jgi:hypothetical protein
MSTAGPCMVGVVLQLPAPLQCVQPPTLTRRHTLQVQPSCSVLPCRQQQCGLLCISVQRMQPSSTGSGDKGPAAHPAASTSIGLQTDPDPASGGSTAAVTTAAPATDVQNAATATDAATSGIVSSGPPADASLPAATDAIQPLPAWQPSVDSSHNGADSDKGSSAAQLYPGGEGIAVQPLAGGGGIAVQPLGGHRGAHPGAAADQSDLRHLLTLSDDEDYLAMPLGFASDSGSDSDAGAWAGLSAGSAAVGSGGAVSSGQPWGGGSGSDDDIGHAGFCASTRQPAER